MSSSTRARAGFTLVEIMIASVIVMILAVIAWPSYTSYVIRSKRVEAISVLMENMQQQERLYALRNRYQAFSREDNPDQFKWHSAAAPSRSSHEINARPCQDQTLASCVELVAEPATAAVDSAYRDPVCGTLTVNSQGLRSPPDPACWR